MSVEKRRVLVTGAAKGIGRAIVRRLAGEGATVFALGRNAEALDILSGETGARPIVADLEDTEAAAARVSEFLPLDGLVNCAGVVTVEPFLETSARNFNETMVVNTWAPLRLGQVVARDCIARGLSASVVNVSSIAATVGTPGHAAYCASKAALDALTRVMAVELGPHGIRVNSVNPVVTWTPMAEKVWSDPAKSGPMKARIPLGRFADVADVAGVVAFLLGDDAAMVNGVSVPVDGGFTAG
ncbi:SDR family oxidoreductase [Arhodomonas sp. AD133]|uniref:SDR family oxidoreductase n=1 Tax=Arhodomonas sp. AD133 TaxID=3415009 RepID=UPI003EBF4507